MVGEAFAAEEAFTAGVVLGPFTAGVSETFTTIAVFLIPVSMATRGGGIGVIPIMGVILSLAQEAVAVVREQRH